MDQELKDHRGLLYLLQLIWLSHFVQVLVPETGFDAIWYHLPVVESIIKNGKIRFFPELYQSLNPLFSDLFFLIGYFFLGITGAKIIAYIFGLLLALVTYKLAKIFLNTKLSLGITILVSTFQVVAWQSSSFYVDLPKAFWEVLAILFLVKATKSQKTSDLIHSSLAFSASLATKLFSIFLIPSYIIIFLRSAPSKKIKKSLALIFLILVFPIYFYFNTYIETGNPFYSFTIHLQKLSEIGGQANLGNYLIQRTSSLVFSPLKLIFSRDYISPLISILLIPVFIKIKQIIKDRKLSILLIFSISQWLLWWYLPPLSTRYALSGFITLLILEIAVLKKYFSKQYFSKFEIKTFGPNFSRKISGLDNKILVALLIFAVINLAPRIVVNIRSLNYLLGNQTQRQYIEKFYDGSIDQKLKDWYGYH